MAESLGDKLKRIAAEKKAARELAEKQASAEGGATPEVKTQVTQTAINSEVTSDEQSKRSDELGTVCGNEQYEVSSGAVEQSQPTTVAEDSIVADGTGAEELNDSQVTGQERGAVETAGPATSNMVATSEGDNKATEVQSISVEPIQSTSIAERTVSDHPLSMQFAEMEQALLTADPTFKTILRDVHRHLGNDPELVTMMTEEEIQLVVRGLIVHAKAEIVEPAKAKTIKKEVAAAKKKVIGADDL